jgi:hypothetical protein
MKKTYCGIELKGNDAILVVLNTGEIVETSPKKITLKDTKIQDDIKSFVLEIIEFLNKYKVDEIGIKERATKGRFAGGAVSFKMEALIQGTQFNVSLFHGKTISAKLKDIKILSDIVLKYQDTALQVAHYLSLVK